MTNATLQQALVRRAVHHLHAHLAAARPHWAKRLRDEQSLPPLVQSATLTGYVFPHVPAISVANSIEGKHQVVLPDAQLVLVRLVVGPEHALLLVVADGDEVRFAPCEGHDETTGEALAAFVPVLLTEPPEHHVVPLLDTLIEHIDEGWGALTYEEDG